MIQEPATHGRVAPGCILMHSLVRALARPVIALVCLPGILLGPSNIIDLHPSIDVDLGHNVTASFAEIDYWRDSLGDGIYGIAGNLLRSGGGSDARHIGNQQEFVINWQLNPLVNILGSYSLFEPGAFIQQTEPAQNIHMFGFEVTWRL